MDHGAKERVDGRDGLGNLSSVEKALWILQFVGQAKQRTLAEITATTRLPKSTTVRLLNTLVNAEFLRRTSHGHYAIAIKVWRIGCSAVSYEDVRKDVIPALQRLVDETSETAFYAVYEDGFAVYVEKLDSVQPIRSFTPIGGRSPAYAAASGKALLAWQPAEEIERVADLAQSHTSTTIAGATAIVDHCTEIRTSGYALNRGEWREGVWGVAAPVRGRDGAVVSSIGISGPRERVETNLDGYVDTVRATAKQLSRLFGGEES